MRKTLSATRTRVSPALKQCRSHRRHSIINIVNRQTVGKGTPQANAPREDPVGRPCKEEELYTSSGAEGLVEGAVLEAGLTTRHDGARGTSGGDAMGGIAEGAKVGVARVGVAWSCRQYLRFSKSPKNSPCLDRVRATWKNNLEKVGARLVDL